MINTVESLDDLPNTIRMALGNANVFYTPNYARYVANTGGTTLYLFSEDYVLLVVLHSKYIFNYTNLPVEYFPITKNESASAAVFLDSCMDLLKTKYHVHWTTATFPSAIFLNYPTTSLRIPFGSHVVDLNDTEDLLWSKVHSKHRNSIRKAEKSAVEIRFGALELLDDYMSLDAQTWERSGRSGTNKKTYVDLMNSLGHNMLISTAYKNELPQGGAIFFYNNAMSYYMYGASKNQPEPGSMNLLHWRTMLYMKNIGVKMYSFVGCRISEDENSKYHDIQRFKERFGGTLIVGYMFKVINSKFLYWLFGLLVRLRSKTAYKDPIDQEIHKWHAMNK